MSEQPIPGTGPSRLREPSCGGPPRGSLFGLAPDGVCRAALLALRAVRSYRTFSPLPAPHRSGAQAVCSLWHFPSESVSAVPPACISGRTGVTRHRALMVFGLSSLRLREERFSALPKSRASYAGRTGVARRVQAGPWSSLIFEPRNTPNTRKWNRCFSRGSRISRFKLYHCRKSGMKTRPE